MHVLRPYQQEALDSLFTYWDGGGENALIEMATGTGKSLVQAKLDEILLSDYAGMRILNLTHVKELIEQNYLELMALWPFAPAGIYSAGLGRRELHHPIVFGGIQSIYTKARQLGHVDLIKIDEAHLLSANAEGMYGQLITGLYEINPDLRVVGFTATPWRTDSGSLVDGDTRLFHDIVYKYGIADGIKGGYLAPLVSKATTAGFDLGGVARRGGDYVAGALQAACDKDETTKAAVDEIVVMGENRKGWVAFCAGVEHALHVRDEIRSRGITCETITGDTPTGDRTRWLAEYKAGKIRCLTNNSVLTTGFNAPHTDLLAMLRPTLSAGLYVQMAGRGTRTSPGKDNCLVLDFAGNVRKHGPVDAVVPRKPGKGDGEAPVKECPTCHSLVHLSAKECPDCGHVFVSEEKPKHEAKADAAPILSGGTPQWLPVQRRSFYHHEKPGGTPTVRVEFTCTNWVVHKTWWCPEHNGFPKDKCDREWKRHGGQSPAPATVLEFIQRKGELNDTKEIQIKPAGRYFEVVGIKAANDNLKGLEDAKRVVHRVADFDDDIPF